MHATTFYNIIVDPITKFQKQRTIISIFSKNQNQRTTNSDHFKTLAEPTALGSSTALGKELGKNQQFFIF